MNYLARISCVWTYKLTTQFLCLIQISYHESRCYRWKAIMNYESSNILINPKKTNNHAFNYFDGSS